MRPPLPASFSVSFSSSAPRHKLFLQGIIRSPWRLNWLLIFGNSPSLPFTKRAAYNDLWFHFLFSSLLGFVRLLSFLKKLKKAGRWSDDYCNKWGFFYIVNFTWSPQFQSSIKLGMFSSPFDCQPSFHSVTCEGRQKLEIWTNGNGGNVFTSPLQALHPPHSRAFSRIHFYPSSQVCRLVSSLVRSNGNDDKRGLFSSASFTILAQFLSSI